MPCTNITPVHPPAPGLPLISAGTDGGVGRFRQINIDGREKKKCGNLLQLHISNQKAIEIVIVFVRRSLQKYAEILFRIALVGADCVFVMTSSVR